MPGFTFLIPFLVAAVAVLNHRVTDKQQNKPLKANPDTVFISRERTPGYYHAVYIEPNRGSESYQNLLNFSMNSDEAALYEEGYEILKRRAQTPMKTYNLVGLPTEWVPLYSYKGKYYLYTPSEPGNSGKTLITGSTLVFWSMEGPSPEQIRTLKKINGHTWYVETVPVGLETGASKLIIHIIDVKNQIAVWEDVAHPAAGRYKLLVPKEKARNFDMIVNYCMENKNAEFIFDPVNYHALLEEK